MAFLQNTGNNTTSDTANVGINAAFGSNTTAGSTIIVGCISGSSSAVTCTDAQGNTYIPLETTAGYWGGNGTNKLYVWYATNIIGGTTNAITVKKTLGATVLNFTANEYSGVDIYQTFDKTAHAGATGFGIPASGNTAFTHWDAELVVGVQANTSGTVETLGSGYGNLQQQQNASGAVAMQDKTQSARQVQSSSFGTSAGNWSAGVYTFPSSPAKLDRNILMDHGIRPYPFSPGMAR